MYRRVTCMTKSQCYADLGQLLCFCFLHKLHNLHESVTLAMLSKVTGDHVQAQKVYWKRYVYFFFLPPPLAGAALAASAGASDFLALSALGSLPDKFVYGEDPSKLGSPRNNVGIHNSCTCHLVQMKHYRHFSYRGSRACR
jgi:hypothetical protein